MRIRSSTLIVIAAGLLGATIPRTGLAEVPGRALPPPRVAVTGDPTPIETQRAAPGEHRTLVISTMPESGANYPVLLTLEPQ